MDNMSAVLILFEGAPEKEEGFVLPDYSKEMPAPPPGSASSAAPAQAPDANPAAPNPMLRMLMVRCCSLVTEQRGSSASVGLGGARETT